MNIIEQEDAAAAHCIEHATSAAEGGLCVRAAARGYLLAFITLAVRELGMADTRRLLLDIASEMRSCDVQRPH